MFDPIVFASCDRGTDPTRAMAPVGPMTNIDSPAGSMNSVESPR